MNDRYLYEEVEVIEKAGFYIEQYISLKWG
jgi:hypothetical protein